MALRLRRQNNAKDGEVEAMINFQGREAVAARSFRRGSVSRVNGPLPKMAV